MIEYGTKDRYVDVTTKAMIQYAHYDSLHIPAGPKNFNYYFGDPYPGMIKELRIKIGDLCYSIKENDVESHTIPISSVNNLLLNLESIHKTRDLVNKFDPNYVNLIIFNDDPHIETSIVMATHNRSKQTYYTLETIERNTIRGGKRVHGVQVIIVDDSTTDPMDCFLLKRFNITIWYIRVKNKFWINPCVNYNLGFKCVKGNNIIIQNSEVFHVGDVINLVQNTLTDNNYLVFDVCGLKDSVSDLNARNIPSTYEIIYNTFNSEWSWYQNSEICNTSYHFLTALRRSTLNLIGSMDYDFSMGLWYDDQEWIYRIKTHNILIVNICHDKYKVMGCHQWHDREVQLIRTNKELFETKQRYYQTHGNWFKSTDYPFMMAKYMVLNVLS